MGPSPRLREVGLTASTMHCLNWTNSRSHMPRSTSMYLAPMHLP